MCVCAILWIWGHGPFVRDGVLYAGWPLIVWNFAVGIAVKAVVPTRSADVRASFTLKPDGRFSFSWSMLRVHG